MAYSVEVFGKENCAQCQAAKAKVTHYLTRQSLTGQVCLVFHDMGTVDGMAEGAFRDVKDIPTTIVSADERQLARWDGKVPTTEEFASSLGQAQA